MYYLSLCKSFSKNVFVKTEQHLSAPHRYNGLHYLHHRYRKNPKHLNIRKQCCNYPKIWIVSLYYRVMAPKDAQRMAYTVCPAQLPLIFWPEAHRPQRSPECTAMNAIWLLRRRFLNVFFFSKNLAFRLPWLPIKISDLDKIHMLVENYSRNISVKILSKYLH